MKSPLVLSVLLIIAVALVPTNALADDINFPGPQNKYYNNNHLDKPFPQSPIALNNTFTVNERLTIYFKLEASPDNCVFKNGDGWLVRLILRNSTWSYTDFGTFDDGSPSNYFTAVPGFDYTLETQFHFPESQVNINDTYEVSIILAIDTETSYNPSYSLSHYVQFSEDPPLPPDSQSEPFPHHIIIALLSTIIVLAVVSYFIIERRKGNKDEKKD